MSNLFKNIFSQISGFQQRSILHKNNNRFWVVKNSYRLIEKMNTINSKKKAREMSTFDFSTLYTELPHQDHI